MPTTSKQLVQHSFRESPQQALADYHATGFHIEYNVFPDELCDAFIKASAELPNAKNGTHRPEMMPHRLNPLYLQGMGHPTLISIMKQLVDGPVSGLQTEFFFCKPGTRGFSLHQDNFFVEAPIGVFASAWVALTDTHPEKGGLIVYPGTHKEGLLPVEPLSLQKDSAQDPNANNEQTVVPKQYEAMHVSVPKGAALFIHGHLVHGSNPNTTNEWRYVLLNTYIRTGEPFRSGKYAQREEVVL